jgi:hypothetical protein
MESSIEQLQGKWKATERRGDAAPHVIRMVTLTTKQPASLMVCS